MQRVFRTLYLVVVVVSTIVQQGEARPVEDLHSGCLTHFQNKKYDHLRNRSYELRRESLPRLFPISTGSSFSTLTSSSERIGISAIIPPAETVPQPTQTIDRVLVVLVEFGEDDLGKPVDHNKISKPLPPKDSTLWEEDFNVQYYQRMLFSRESHFSSMANYYYEQSSGRYTVEGQVIGWFKLPHSAKYYGEDQKTDEGSRHDMKNGSVWKVVADAILSAQIDIDWNYFDQEDRYDYDGDGNLREPDGYVDHLMVVHAGMGQEAGGGEQGDDALWSHRFMANYMPGGGSAHAGPKKYQQNGGIKLFGQEDMWALDYTLMPENGGLGVFAHEYGHDLGLPDLYDTNPVNNSQSAVAFWSIMSSGSWTAGENLRLGTMPTHLEAWGKMQLGWLDYEEVSLPSLRSPKRILLDRASFKGRHAQGLKINLPPSERRVAVAEPTSGQTLYHGGLGNRLDTWMMRIFDFKNVTSEKLTLMFNVSYDIEENYDYAYVEVLAEDGKFVSIPGSMTTNHNPYHLNLGNGITGQSLGWEKAVFDLTPFIGKIISLRIRYKTEANDFGTGLAIDDIMIPEISYLNNVENQSMDWQLQGFQKLLYGQYFEKHEHYYLAEWRSYSGYDEALSRVYKGMPPGENLPDVEFYKYAPGLVLWYRNLEYREGDNQVGRHPGEGFLLAVDAHPEPRMLTAEKPWSTPVQIFDAAFSLINILPFELTDLLGEKKNFSASAQATFDDALKYYFEEDPDNSVKVPNLGLQLEVIQTSFDGSAALIEIRNKNSRSL